MRTKNRLRSIGALAAISIILLPVSIVVTIFLMPFWKWIEATFAVESVGHSGPAEWCYLACYGILFIFTYSVWKTVSHRHRKHQNK